MMPAPLPVAPTIPATPSAVGLGGLIALVEGAERPLPLREVRVRASIAGTCCRTVIEQRFANPLEVGLEAVHLFPLPPDGAVTEVELRCGELVVRALCKERGEAEAEFDQARQTGRRAALLTQERDDVHTLRVTNLPPGDEVTVRIVVVEHLESVDGRLRWRFPTTIPPRYLSGDATGQAGAGVLPDTDRVPDASRLQPPLRLAGGTRLDLEVEVAGPVSEVASSLHAVRLGLDGGGVRVAPSGQATLDRDFVLAIATGDADAVATTAWTDGSHTLVVVHPPTGVAAAALPRDVVFVVDISGSMSGRKLDAARTALSAALHGLLPGDRFRLVAFDDRIEELAPDFVDYDDRSLARADRWIEALDARGGTEMLPAIQAALRGTTPQGRVRTVLFITDGQAWNEAELAAAVSNRRNGARFFTLGIDTAVNSALLQRLARVGGGTCELATPHDDLGEVIANLEARFGSPIADGVRVADLTETRGDAEVVFAGRAATLLCEGTGATVVVQGRTASGPFTTRVEARPAPFPLGALWARARIAALGDRITLRPFEEEAVRPEIVRISVEYQVVSRYTAFVAVEEHPAWQGERREVVQPHELPETWSADFLGAGMAAPVTAMPTGAPMAAAPPRMQMRLEERSTSSAAPRMGAVGAAGAAVGGLLDAAFGGRKRRGHGPAPEPDAMASDEEVDGFVPPSPPTLSRRLAESRPSPKKAADPGAELARQQRADGSFEGDVAHTAAALLALVLLGHTRRAGSRRRTVLKAATWLATRRDQPWAARALDALEAAERGEAVAADPSWAGLADSSAVGRILAALL